MKPRRQMERERQRRKAWHERKLTPKQLDALAAVAYGELLLATHMFSSRGGTMYSLRWTLDNIDVRSRLVTLRGYRFIKRAPKDSAEEMILSSWILTEDGASYLKREGLY